MKMKCIIVDDKNSCKQLEKYVSEYEKLDLIRMVHDKRSFLEEISNSTDIDIGIKTYAKEENGEIDKESLILIESQNDLIN